MLGKRLRRGGFEDAKFQGLESILVQTGYKVGSEKILHRGSMTLEKIGESCKARLLLLMIMVIMKIKATSAIYWALAPPTCKE